MYMYISKKNAYIHVPTIILIPYHTDNIISRLHVTNMHTYM